VDTDLYTKFISLYAGAEYDDIWKKLFKAGAFIREIGTELGNKLDYGYPLQVEINVENNA